MYLPDLGNGSSIQSLRLRPNFDLAFSPGCVRISRTAEFNTIYWQKSEERNC
jgi:hypothetical protein